MLNAKYIEEVISLRKTLNYELFKFSFTRDILITFKT